jgi:Cu-Zn family superoxide dismutase
MKSKKIIAIACFQHGKIKGFIKFTEINNKKISIMINLEGLPKNSTHAIHIHEAGDLSDDCTSACSHFNPFNKNHGGINSKERHVGDLGNISTDKNGKIINMEIIDNMIKLRGNKSNIIGRSVVLHEDEDDNGLGNFPDSKTTGHSGKRIACAIIGYSKDMF